MSLVFVTGNKGKLEEVSTLLGFEVESVDLQIEEIQDLDIKNVARSKAEKAYEIIKKPLIVDDTGITIDEWNGFPGPFLAHILKAGGKELILKMMESASSRSATFSTAIAYHDGKVVQIFEGALRGSISTEIKGDRGFGIDGIFIPAGFDKTFAQLTLEEKNKLSNRGMAVRKLKMYLQNNKL